MDRRTRVNWWWSYFLFLCPWCVGCMTTKLAIGNEVKSPVVIGSRLHIGEGVLQASPTQDKFECSAQQQFIAAGSSGGSGWSRAWKNNLVEKANWAVQGSARRAIRNCEITSKGMMVNALFLIWDRQQSDLTGEVVEIEREEEGFADTDEGDEGSPNKPQPKTAPEEVTNVTEGK